MRYDAVNNQFNEYFYDKMKEDFRKIIGHEKYDDCMKELTLFNRDRFESVVYSNNFEEFEILLKNAHIRKNNRTLHSKIKKAEKLNEPINNFSTWKFVSGENS